MLNRQDSLARQASRGFTIIELMVVVAIIIILATLLLAVGSSVSKKSKISSTRTNLVTLEGIIKQFQEDNPGVLNQTLYATDGNGGINEYSSGSVTAPSVNFVDQLYSYPKTKTMLEQQFGSTKLVINRGTGKSAVLDNFGNPISYVTQNTAGVSGPWFAATQDYLRSSGPDGVTQWGSKTDPSNDDDILSYETPK